MKHHHTFTKAVSAQESAHPVRRSCLSQKRQTPHTTPLLLRVDSRELTRIDLLDLRQRQPHLVPVQRRLPRLQRVALKVHRLQLLLVAQLALHLREVRQLAVAGPELFQVDERAKVRQILDRVAGYVNDAEVGVVLEAVGGREGVVGDVEFFEIDEFGEAGDGGEAVGLDGENLEVRKSVEALWRRVSVASE